MPLALNNKLTIRSALSTSLSVLCNFTLSSPGTTLARQEFYSISNYVPPIMVNNDATITTRNYEY